MYPKAKYHPTQTHRIVNSEAEEKDLGGDWFDSPNFNAPAEQKAEEKADAAHVPFQDEDKAEKHDRVPKHK